VTVAKLTIADVSQTTAVHEDRIGKLEDDVGGLIDRQREDLVELTRLREAMTSVADLRTTVAKLAEQQHADHIEIVRLREELAAVRADAGKAGEVEKAAADLKQELAVTKQQLAEHLKRVEVWDARR
jgi:predicted  nucleic acid-binding Zn-ribbon protein